MADAYSILADRVVDKLPLSVGTSLAIEALKDNDTYDTLWINSATLFRNIYEAVDRDRRNLLTPAAIATTIEEEISFIRRYLGDKIDGVRLYHLGYRDLAKRYPHAILFTPKSDIQIQYDQVMNDSLEVLLGRDDGQTIEQDKGSELRGETTKSLIITHYPTDLLSRTKFNQLRLLESHTGAIKTRSQWFTKLTDGKDLKIIPFNYFTIQIFGDGKKHFNRYPVKVRQAIIEIAKQYKWTPLTTMDKIRYGINRMPDQYAAAQLRQVF